MRDPAIDDDDIRQDAELAVLEKRVTPRGKPTVMANARRTVCRRALRRNALLPEIAQHITAGRKIVDDPGDIVANGQLCVEIFAQIYCKSPLLLILCLLLRDEFSLDHIQQITGKSRSTISHAFCRIRKICGNRLPPEFFERDYRAGEIT